MLLHDFKSSCMLTFIVAAGKQFPTENIFSYKNLGCEHERLVSVNKILHWMSAIPQGHSSDGCLQTDLIYMEISMWLLELVVFGFL